MSSMEVGLMVCPHVPFIPFICSSSVMLPAAVDGLCECRLPIFYATAVPFLCYNTTKLDVTFELPFLVVEADWVACFPDRSWQLYDT